MLVQKPRHICRGQAGAHLVAGSHNIGLKQGLYRPPTAEAGNHPIPVYRAYR